MRGACCPVTQHLSCGCRRLSYLVSESAVWAEPVGTARRAPEAGALLSDKETNRGQKLSRCGTLGRAARCQTRPCGPMTCWAGWSSQAQAASCPPPRPARGERVRSQPVEGRKRGSRALSLEGQLSQGLLPAQFAVREADRTGLPLLLAPVLSGPRSAARRGQVSGGSWPRLPLPWSVRGSSSPNG